MLHIMFVLQGTGAANTQPATAEVVLERDNVASTAAENLGDESTNALLPLPTLVVYVNHICLKLIAFCSTLC